MIPRTSMIGSKAAQARLNRAQSGLKNMGAATKAAAVFLDQWVQLNFQTEGGKVGGWQKFKYGGRTTVKKKASAKVDGRYVNTSAKLLLDSGALRKSFHPFSDNNKAGIGSPLPYSQYHEEGIGIVRRRLLPNNKDVHSQVTRIFESHVRKALNA